MRKLIVLMALLAMLGLLAVAASGANASEEGSNETSVVAGGSEESAPESEEAPPSSPSAALSGCPIGIVCVWTGKGFSGAEGRTPCSQTGFHPLAGNKWSAANGCESRAVFLRHAGAY